jgi:hypothetical protein
LSIRPVLPFVTLVILLLPSAQAQLPSAQAQAVPWGIHVAYGVDPSDTVIVAWLQPRNAEQLASAENRRVVVEYGTTTDYGMVAHIQTRPYNGLATQTPFAAILAGLEPGTTYHYRIGSTVPGWSPDYTFTTAPRGPANFTVTAYGDQGTGRSPQEDPPSTLGTASNHPSRRIVDSVRTESPNLHLHLGDLSYDDWDEWQAIIEPLAAEVPYMVAAGNHDIDEERNIKEYDARMVMPSAVGTYYYAFTYGHVRFIALDSENWCERTFAQYQPSAGVYYSCGDDPQPNLAQLSFLERELALARSDPEIRFIVPFFHRPVLSDGRHGSHPMLQALWRPLFDHYKPELVLAGHDHLYERSLPVVNNQPQVGGTTYVVSGGAGHGLYQFQNETMRDWEAARASVYHYTVLHVTPDAIHLVAKDLDGKVIDEVTLTSNAETWQAGLEVPPPAKMPFATLLGGLIALLAAVLLRRRPN